MSKNRTQATTIAEELESPAFIGILPLNVTEYPLFGKHPYLFTTRIVDAK